jgi:hypothetical protein
MAGLAAHHSQNVPGRVVPVPQLPKYAAYWVRTVMRVAVITPMMWAWSLLPFAGVSSASRVNVPA